MKSARRRVSIHPDFAAAIRGAGIQWRHGHVFPPAWIIELGFPDRGAVFLLSRELVLLACFARDVGYAGPRLVEDAIETA